MCYDEFLLVPMGYDVLIDDIALLIVTYSNPL